MSSKLIGAAAAAVLAPITLVMGIGIGTGSSATADRNVDSTCLETKAPWGSSRCAPARDGAPQHRSLTRSTRARSSTPPRRPGPVRRRRPRRLPHRPGRCRPGSCAVPLGLHLVDVGHRLPGAGRTSSRAPAGLARRGRRGAVDVRRTRRGREDRRGAVGEPDHVAGGLTSSRGLHTRALAPELIAARYLAAIA